MGSPQSKLLGASPESQGYVDYKPGPVFPNQTYTNGTSLSGTAMSREHCLAVCYQNLCGGWTTYTQTTGACAFRQPQPNPENITTALYANTSPTSPPSWLGDVNLTGGGVTCPNSYTPSSRAGCLGLYEYTSPAYKNRQWIPGTQTCRLCQFQSENGTDFMVGLSPPTTRSTIKPWLSFEDVSARNQLDGAIIALQFRTQYVTAIFNGDLRYIDASWNYGGQTGLDIATKFLVKYPSATSNYFNIEPLYDTSHYLQYANEYSYVKWTASAGTSESSPSALFGVDLEGTPQRIVRITPGNSSNAYMTDASVDHNGWTGVIMGGAGVAGRIGGILPIIIEQSPYVKAYAGVKKEECCFGTYKPTSSEYKICEDLKVTPDSKACIGPDITHGVTGIISEYCSAHIGNDQRCLTFCKDKKVDCDNLIQTYCQRIGPESAAGTDICGCFRGVDFYENFFNQLKSNVSISTAYPDFPQCYYKPCATSNWQNYRTKSLGSQCPNITSCITVNEFNNVTGDIGSITIEQTNECKSVQQNITPVSPVTGQVTITSVDPDYGPPAGGTNITINGSNFELGATVTMGGKVATSTWVSATKFSAVTPPGTGTVNISITNPESSTGNLPNAFSYSTTPVLKLTTLNPGSGPAGTLITLTGSNFQTGTVIYFGDTLATNTKFNSPTQITTILPAGTGRVDVTVENPGGQSFTLPQSFVYSNKPSSKKGIPWWVWLLLALFILLIFIAILSALRRKRARARKLAVAREIPVLGSQFDVGF